MNKGLYVDAEKLSFVIENVLPIHIGMPGSGVYGEQMVKKNDVLRVIELMLEIKDK